MSINSEKEKEYLKESLKRTENLQRTLECLEQVLVKKTPFALYIATADRSDCSWIFDPELIYGMIGGEHQYKEVVESLFETEEERATGIVLFILKKIGPLYSVRVDLETINEIIDDLYNEI